MRISKNPHTALKTNPSGLRSFRSFICAVRFDMRLIHSNKHRPFQIVARPIRFTIRSSENEIISFRIAHFIYYSLSWLCFKQRIKIFFQMQRKPAKVQQSYPEHIAWVQYLHAEAKAENTCKGNVLSKTGGRFP